MDQTLRTQILAALHLEDAPGERQTEVLGRIEHTARQRLAVIFPDLLTPRQLEEVGRMRTQGMNETEIAHWAMAQTPESYDHLLDAAIRSVAAELIDTMQKVRERTAG